jgi:hypothetical protein
MMHHQYGFSPAYKCCVYAWACKMIDDECVYEIGNEED